MSNVNTKLNLKNIPKLVGESASKTFDKCYKVLENTNWPLYIVGPSGSGKSVIAMNLAKQYAEEYEVPAYYVQLSPELTKTSLILGLRLINGSLTPVDGIVAQCMQEGGIIIVDEATHGSQELLLMFNSILDRTSATSIGDKIIYAVDSFRIIFCSNDSTYAGNIRLPQSFAQRLIAFCFDYPEWIDEAKIIRTIAKAECLTKLDVPTSVVKYVTSVIREIRTKEFPLSARNGAIATVLLSLADKPDTKSKNPSDNIDDYFKQGQNVESIRKTIAKRVLNREAKDVIDLQHEDVIEVIEYISQIGISEFRQIMYSACMYHLDVDGIELNAASIKIKIESTVV